MSNIVAEKPASQGLKWRDVLSIHEAANLLPLMELEAQRDLGRDVKVHGLQARAVVYVNANGERSLLDGRNRLDGMEYVGLPVLKNGTLDPNIFQEISNVDPIAYVLSANLHRRHLSAKDKRALIGNLLQAYPDKSDRQIAHSSASPTTPSPTSAANSKHVGKLPTSKTALIRRVGSSRRRTRLHDQNYRRRGSGDLGRSSQGGMRGTRCRGA